MKAKELKDVWFHLTGDLLEFQRRIVDPICQKNGLTGQQMRVLLALDEQSDQSVGDLSASVAILRTNIAAVCRKLEEEQFIQRSRTGQDKRYVTVRLTDRGRAALDQVRADFNTRYRKAFASEPKETFETILRGIEALQAFLKKF